MRYAGHLYAPNDYAAATELTRRLVHDEAARQAMGRAARAHVEKLGWMAAVRRIRDHQYQRAIRTFRAHKRCGTPSYKFHSSVGEGRGWDLKPTTRGL